jgi:transposase
VVARCWFQTQARRRSPVQETLKRAQTVGLFWPLPEAMNDGALEAALYASRRSKRRHRRIEEPDWASVRRELKRKHVTLLIPVGGRPDRSFGLVVAGREASPVSRQVPSGL